LYGGYTGGAEIKEDEGSIDGSCALLGEDARGREPSKENEGIFRLEGLSGFVL
jgi:hypothetical protein